MKMSRTDQDYIAKYAGNNVRYFPALAHVFGSTNAAIMMSQLLYWDGKGHRYDGWIFKTSKEMGYETGLTRYQIQTAEKILKKHGCIQTKIAGIPAKKHYFIDQIQLVELLSCWRETAHPEVIKSLNKNAGKQRTITETITDILSKPP